MSHDDKFLVWIDLETTGTSSEDLILEIGLTVTDMNLNSVDANGAWAEFQTVIHYPDIDRFPMPEVVRTMHEVNGLLTDIKSGKGLTLPDAEEHIIDLLRATGGLEHEFVLAGSGVGHFDRRFLDLYMPTLTKWLRYYSVDIGVVRRFLHDVVGLPDDMFAPASDQETKTHRAMDDIRQHLEEARHYCRLMRSLVE